MDVLVDREALVEWRSSRAAPIAIVPTMGALHSGHISLIQAARESVGDTGQILVTIFVNPLQFDRPSDLQSYPVAFQADLDQCRAAGADAVFSPQPDEFYAPDRSITVTESALSTGLCGATRPGHFDGVCTVVLKLFLLSGASVAVFGEKDFQQLAIIRRMVRDLDAPIEIVSAPTFREADGLAMSSRNVRLTPEARVDAPRIRRALQEAEMQGSPAQVLAVARAIIQESDAGARIDYLELMDAETLQPARDLARPVVLATAVFYGDVRLIDNIVIAP